MNSAAQKLEASGSVLSGRQKALVAILALLPVAIVLMLSLRGLQGRRYEETLP